MVLLFDSMDPISLVSVTNQMFVSFHVFCSHADASQVTDDQGTAWTEFVKAGDKVKVKIISINAESKKIAVGIKESLFSELDEEEEDSDDEEAVELEGSDDDEVEDENEDEIVVEDDSDIEMEVRKFQF